MELVMRSGLFSRKRKQKHKGKSYEDSVHMGHNLTHAAINHTYVIEGIETNDQSMKDFLFTLGCFEGEKVTLISVLSDNYVIHVKDARYSIDSRLAKAIRIGEPV